MIDYLGYNLTEYKSFRQLQLQYIKCKNQNQSLQSQMQLLRQNYGQKCKQLIELKREWLQEKMKVKNKNLKYKRLYRQLVENIEANLSCINRASSKNNNQSPSSSPNKPNDKSIFVHLQQAQNLQKICSKLSAMAKEYISLSEKNAQLQQQLQTVYVESKGEETQKQQTQFMIMRQVNHLESQLEQFQQQKAQLEAIINIKDREKRRVEIQLREKRKECVQLQQRMVQLVRKNDQKTQEDSQFALDFMTFQLQTIQSLFTRVAQSTTCSTDLSHSLSLLYTDYQQLSQIFRQKLQIEYDLQELQQGYKRQKSSNTVQEHLMIQTRRQIETFRLQLLRQKEIFRQKQQYIEDRFQEYQKINEGQMKVRNYSYEVENKLYKQKRSQIETCERTTTRNPTARDILNKRLQNQKTYKGFTKEDAQQQILQRQQLSLVGKKSSLRFKQTNNVEELMQEMIKKDKKNLQKILKETRRPSIPIYKGN